MSNKRFRRWHRLKWLGLAACVALLVAWVVMPTKITAKSTEVWFHNSIIFFYQSVGPGISPEVWHNWKVGIANNPGLLPKYRSITIQGAKLIYVSLPPQPILFIMVLATGVLWWLDRRYRYLPGYCQKCGYDLKGNESGVCSECGTAIRKTEAAPVANE